MLVISRRIGESFLIGENIEATVVDITGDKVLLGITAPREVPITRCEIDEIRRANTDAGRSPAGNINMRGFAKIYKSKFMGTDPGKPGESDNGTDPNKE